MGSPINAADILRESFAIFTRHLSLVLSMSFAIQLLWVVGSFVAFQNGGLVSGTLTFGFLGLFTALLQAAVMTRLALAVRQGIEPEFGQIVIGSLPKLLPLFVLFIAMGFVIILGFVAFIIPGVFLLLRWGLAPTIYMAGGTSVMDVLKTSWRATASGSAMFTMFVLMAFQVLCNQGIPWLAEQATGPVGDLGSSGFEMYLILVAIATAVIGPLPWIAFAEYYLELGGVRPGSTTASFGTPMPGGGPGGHVHVPAGMTGVATAAAAAPGYGAPGAYGQPAAAYGQPPAAAYGGQPPAPPYGAPSPYGQPAGAPHGHYPPQPGVAPQQYAAQPAAAPQQYAAQPAMAPQYPAQQAHHGAPGHQPPQPPYAAPQPPHVPPLPAHPQQPAAYGQPAPVQHPQAGPLAHPPAPQLHKPSPPLAPPPQAPAAPPYSPPPGAPAAPPVDHAQRRPGGSVAPPGI